VVVGLVPSDPAVKNTSTVVPVVPLIALEIDVMVGAPGLIPLPRPSDREDPAEKLDIKGITQI
jgi:hypothetical protein